METALDILKYILPSLVVFATAYFVIVKFLENDHKKHRYKIVSDNRKILIPIRLQAYERLALFLERISPESLIMRIQVPGYTAQQMQAELHNTIRIEFEHNLSQQIYISAEAWKVIKSSKENVIKLINSAAGGINPESSAFELNKAILNTMMKMENSPVATGLDFLKKEIQQFY